MVKKLSRQQKIIKPDMQALKAAQESLNKIYAPSPALTLCGQLEDAIVLLETRISNAIAKINSLM